MNIITVKNYEEMSKMAAHILAAQVIAKPDSVLGLATGSTPIGIYDCLAEWCKNGEVDFSKAATVNLDEYRGLDHSNDQSYYYFMNKHLFSKNYGMGGALSVFLFIITGVLSLIVFRFNKIKD